MVNKVILVGGFHEMIELCEDCGYSIVGIIDNTISTNYWNYPIIGTDGDCQELYKKYADIPLVITPDAPIVRKNLFQLYAKVGFHFETVISPSARISRSATIGIGSVIQSGVNVSSNALIGDFVKLNTLCNVMHDCDINDFATVAPNAVLLGKVSIGEGAYIGVNSTTLPYKKIGVSSIVGAGAVVTKDVEDYSVVKGVPAE